MHESAILTKQQKQHFVSLLAFKLFHLFAGLQFTLCQKNQLQGVAKQKDLLHSTLINDVINVYGKLSINAIAL